MLKNEIKSAFYTNAVYSLSIARVKRRQADFGKELEDEELRKANIPA